MLNKNLSNSADSNIKVSGQQEEYFKKISQYVENHPEYDETIEETCGSWKEFQRTY
tara:strand:- start:3630 stop:3797 length:168 start_codon:yes stop_codon:yes gene_type:complete